MLEALGKRGGLWFGWSGEINDRPDAPKLARTGGITALTCDLSHADYEGYYAGFSNRSLWPLCHYRLDLAHFERDWYIAYRRVNQHLAEALIEKLEPDDIVWVHDYHLLVFAEELRRLGARNRIGLFFHIPFPAPELFVALPQHGALARAMGDYDVLGFQTEIDADNFRAYLTREGIGRVRRDGRVTIGGRRVTIGVYPIGIDVETFREMAYSADAVRQAQRLRRSVLGGHLIIGVDRLDYSKGIDERLRAFRSLLSNYPQYHGKVTYVQISAPSREEVKEYIEIRRQVEQTAGRINGRYSQLDWVPLRYINRSFSRRALAGFYRVARIGLVTPLRDGMNLVAKEFVAAQDEADPGVLVLSRFAGAAEGADGALIVNPYDVEGTGDALYRGLAMPLDERQDRWRRLFAWAQRDDVASWSDRFLNTLAEAG